MLDNIKITGISEIKISYFNKYKINNKITKSQEANNYIRSIWDKNLIELKEEVKVIYLNSANQINGYFNLASGGINSCVVDIRILLSIALKTNSTGFILVHNHPSGNLKPSAQDLELTKRLSEVAKLMYLVFIDHLILSKDNYYSFKDNDML